MSKPHIFRDSFSIDRGCATFDFMWESPMGSDDKADLILWLDLVKKRILRLPDVGPIAPKSDTGATP